MGTAAAILGAAAIGAIASDQANRSAINAQKQQAYAAWQAEKQRAWADAQLAMDLAAANADAILAGAAAQAEGALSAASAQAEAAIAGANLQAGYTKEAAMVGYDEAMRNVELMKKEHKETLRKMGEQQENVEDTAMARIGASGGTYSGSSENYHQAMQKEHKKQHSYTKDAFRSQRQTAKINAEEYLQANLGYASAIKKMGALSAAAAMEAAHAMAGAYMGAAEAQAAAAMDAAEAQRNAVEEAYGPLASTMNLPTPTLQHSNNYDWNQRWNTPQFFKG